MRIDRINIKNFRGIEDLTLDLNPQFNLLIGENGSGKTAILTALAVGAGCFFSGFGSSSRNIQRPDIRYFKTPEGDFVFAEETRVEVLSGIVAGEVIRWHKARFGINHRTSLGQRSPIKAISIGLNRSIRDSRRTQTIDLPVLAYYSTARLWKEGSEGQDHLDEEGQFVRNFPTRFRGYVDALDIKSTFNRLLEWFKGKYADMRITGNPTFQLQCVESVIVRNVPGVTRMRWVFDTDKIQTLYIIFENGDEVPFSYLSDGYRNLLAMFADLAWRCVTLNPHFGAEANLRSEGIVLIDEIDLHLHPAWQKLIVKQLKETFPKIQFVATTHSPFVIQETAEGELYRIQGTGTVSIGGADEYSLEDVAEYLQGVPDPAWSSEKKNMYLSAKEYFDLLNRLHPETPSEELNAIRERLNLLGRAYSTNMAYTAFLEQKRMMAESKLDKS